MKIAKHNVVTMHYTLKDGEGQTIDSSEGQEPLVFIQGVGQIIPGLETELEGKVKGDKLQVVIKPEDAYGERSDQMIQNVPKSEFQDAGELAVGMQFQVETDNGPIALTIIEILDEEVVLDGNHPLAGVTLHFDVEIADVRVATEDEISHGHVHGKGCNH
jgi:FKBP-type peptidyl-prolyl cis-trans isomerase SlyD